MSAHTFSGPHKLRTIFGVQDDLQDFAEDWLNRPCQLMSALAMRRADGALVAPLYCDDHYQVELCAVPGGLVIPAHVHPRADTIEVGVSGALRLIVNGVDVFAGIPDETLIRLNHWRGIRINHSDVHGTVVGEPGAMFMSIQRWNGCAPKSVLTDYEGGVLGPQHKEMLP